MDHVQFFQAAGTGDVAAVISLIERGADPNWIVPQVGHTPLYNACVSNRPQVVRALITLGANPNLRMNYHSPVDGRRENGVVALMFARSPEVVVALVAAGADVNAADEDGLTSLIRAAYWGKRDVVKALLDAGADAALKTKSGRSAKDVAASRIDEYRSWAAGPNNEVVAQRIKVFEDVIELLESCLKPD
jgi:ankyrin repeat protein